MISCLSRARVSGFGEPLQERRAPAFLRPRRNRRFEPGSTGRVDVHVRSHVHTSRAGGVDQLPGLFHQRAPAWLPRGLEVKDLDRQSTALADGDGLGDCRDQVLAFVAHVRGIRAAVLTGDFRDLHEFVRRRETARRINQRGRHAHGAGRHRRLHDRLHLGEFVGGRRPRGVAEHRGARLRLAEVRAEVDADAGLLRGPAKYPGMRSAGTGVPPSPPIAVVTPMRSLFSARPFCGRTRAGLVHHVDPAGRDESSARVDLPPAVAGDVTNLGEPAVGNRDVRQIHGLPMPSITRPPRMTRS